MRHGVAQIFQRPVGLFFPLGMLALAQFLLQEFIGSGAVLVVVGIAPQVETLQGDGGFQPQNRRPQVVASGKCSQGELTLLLSEVSSLCPLQPLAQAIPEKLGSAFERGVQGVQDGL